MQVEQAKFHFSMIFQFQNKAVKLNHLGKLESKRSFSVVYCSFLADFCRYANIEQIKFGRTYVSDLLYLISVYCALMVEICHSRLTENEFVSTRTANNVP